MLIGAWWRGWGWLGVVAPLVALVFSLFAGLAFGVSRWLWALPQIPALLLVAGLGLVLHARGRAARGPDFRWWEWVFDAPLGDTPFHSLLSIQLHLWAVLPLGLFAVLIAFDPTAPEAHAGYDSRVSVGEATPLDGTLSVTHEHPIRWSIVEAPEGHMAAIEAADVLFTSITPDLAGTWRIALTIEGDPPAQDEVVIEVVDPP